MIIATFESIALDDLARWIRKGDEPAVEEGMRRLAQAADKAACCQSCRSGVERRRQGRVRLPRLLYLTPLDADGHVVGEAFPVISRQISEGGIDFFSDQPVPFRYVHMDMAGDGDERVSLVSQLRWCRFSQLGVYVNGGAFVGRSVSRITAAKALEPAGGPCAV